jgi:hypothetical protein
MVSCSSKIITIYVPSDFWQIYHGHLIQWDREWKIIFRRCGLEKDLVRRQCRRSWLEGRNHEAMYDLRAKSHRNDKRRVHHHGSLMMDG